MTSTTGEEIPGFDDLIELNFVEKTLDCAGFERFRKEFDDDSNRGAEMSEIIFASRYALGNRR